jgi:hypothetical protein
MSSNNRTSHSKRSPRSKPGATQARSKKARPADKRRASAAAVQHASAKLVPNELAQRVIRSLCKRRSGQEAPPAPPPKLPRVIDRETTQNALAVLLNIPKSRVTKALLDKHIRQIRKDAEDDATRVAGYLDQLIDHLTLIGCTTDGEIDEYLVAEEQVLLDLYAELRFPQPSPTRLLQLSVQYALDARQRINGTIHQLEIRQRKGGYEIAVHPPGQIKLRSIPYPGRVVRNPCAIELLRFVQQSPPSYFRMVQWIESVLQHVPSYPDRSESTASKPLPSIVVDLEDSVVLLFGKPYPVSLEGARFVKLLNNDPNVWVAPSDYEDDVVLKNSRLDREFKKLPKPIKSLIESKKGSGYRLSKQRLAELCQKLSLALPAKAGEDGQKRRF